MGKVLWAQVFVSALTYGSAMVSRDVYQKVQGTGKSISDPSPAAFHAISGDQR